MKRKPLICLVGAVSLLLSACNADGDTQENGSSQPNPSASPTVSPSLTPSGTTTASPAPSSSISPTVSPSLTPSPSTTPLPSATPAPSTTPSPSATPEISLPQFANQANLRFTPLAQSVLLEWDDLQSADSVTIFYDKQAINASSPAAGSQVLPVGSCQTSPCVLPLPPGELHYLALQTKDATNAEIDFSQIMAASGQINDSGAVRCYALNTGIAGGFDVADCSAESVQDANVGRDASAPTKLGSGSGGFDFTKLNSAGEPVTDGSEHTCVRDNLTGLVWEVKTTSNRDVRYVWGAETGSAAADVNAFVAATNNAGLCGLSNWRLPTANELFGLVDFDKPHGITTWAGADGNIDEYISIDRGFFPNTRLINYSPSRTSSVRIRHAHYWTSDSYMNQYSDPNYTLVDFFRGSLVNTSNPHANFVLFGVIHDGAFARLVSNGPEGVQP